MTNTWLDPEEPPVHMLITAAAQSSAVSMVLNEELIEDSLILQIIPQLKDQSQNH
jgi:hypothetical protein